MTTQVQMTTVFLLMVVQSSSKLLTVIVWIVKLGKINDSGIALAAESVPIPIGDKLRRLCGEVSKFLRVQIWRNYIQHTSIIFKILVLLVVNK